MSIKEQILNDIKSAMKSQNAFERYLAYDKLGI